MRKMSKKALTAKQRPKNFQLDGNQMKHPDE